MSFLDDLKKILFVGESVTKSAADKAGDYASETGGEMLDKTGEMLSSAKESAFETGGKIYEKSGDPKVDYLVSFSYLTKTTFWQLMAKRVLMGNAPDPHKQYVLNEIGPLFSPFGDKPDAIVSL